MLAKIEAIFQGGGKINSWIASWHILESGLIITFSVSNLAASDRANLTTLASTWRRKGGFCFLRASENQITSSISSHQG